MLSLWPCRPIKPRRYLLLRQAVVDSYVDEVCARAKVPRAEVLGQSRRKEVAHARQEVMFLLRQEVQASGHPKYSYPEIGRVMGFDHTTILHGVRAHKARMICRDRKAKRWAA